MTSVDSRFRLNVEGDGTHFIAVDGQTKVAIRFAKGRFYQTCQLGKVEGEEGHETFEETHKGDAAAIAVIYAGFVDMQAFLCQCYFEEAFGCTNDLLKMVGRQFAQRRTQMGELNQYQFTQARGFNHSVYFRLEKGMAPTGFARVVEFAQAIGLEIVFRPLEHE